MVFLLAAAWISGLLNGVFNALAGTLPGTPGMSVCVVSAGAVLCYVAIKPCGKNRGRGRSFSIVFAALAIAALAALAVRGWRG